MIELVTGHGGISHVDAGDMRSLLKGIVGNVNGLMPNSESPNVSPALSMKIPALEILWLKDDGVGHCRLDGTDTVSIAGTSQNMYRKDYICLKYTLDQVTAVESLELDVLQGNPASTQAGANYPTYSNTTVIKRLPIYAVDVYQNTVQGIGFLLDRLKSMNSNDNYPVGSVYISVINTNPSYVLGGTWERFGKGKCLVGVDESDSDFSTAKKTGGSKFMQEHSHTFASKFSHNHQSGNTAHDYHYLTGYGTFAQDTVGEISGSGFNVPKLSNATQNNWQLQKSTNTVDISISGDTGKTGAGKSENLQPYVTVYMWIRTA